MRRAYLWTLAVAAVGCLAFSSCNDDDVDLCESFWNWCDQCKADCSGQKDWLNEETCDDINSNVDNGVKKEIVDCIDSGCVPRIDHCLEAFGVHRRDYDPGHKAPATTAKDAGR